MLIPSVAHGQNPCVASPSIRNSHNDLVGSLCWSTSVSFPPKPLRVCVVLVSVFKVSVLSLSVHISLWGLSDYIVYEVEFVAYYYVHFGRQDAGNRGV